MADGLTVRLEVKETSVDAHEAVNEAFAVVRSGLDATRGQSQTIGFAAEELLTPGDLSLANRTYLMVKNVDATNRVQIRAALAETPFVDLAPGEHSGIIPLAANVAPTAQALVANVRVLKWWWDS